MLELLINVSIINRAVLLILSDYDAEHGSRYMHL